MKIKSNELEIDLSNKIVKLRGHLDEGVFRVFTESLEKHPLLSSQEKMEIRKIVGKYSYIVID